MDTDKIQDEAYRESWHQPASVTMLICPVAESQRLIEEKGLDAEAIVLEAAASMLTKVVTHRGVGVGNLVSASIVGQENDDYVVKFTGPAGLIKHVVLSASGFRLETPTQWSYALTHMNFRLETA